jgi:MATE family, multidrug efflux pump
VRFGGLSRAVWTVSLPLIFVAATETIDHLIDTVMLARVGITELGAIGVADAVMLLFLIAPLSLADGIQILTARGFSLRRPGVTGAIFNDGLLLVLGVGVVSAVALKVSSSFLVPVFVESAAVTRAVDGYLQLDAYSIPLAGVTFACGALLTSLGRTRVLIPATILLVIVDALLNAMFIFGLFGAPALGMRGAAVGSIGAELAVAVFLLVYLKRAFAADYGLLRRRDGTTRTFAPRLARISSPIAAQALLEDIRWFLFFVTIERLGAGPLAAANVVFTCFIVFSIPMEAFWETACSMVGRCVGSDRTHRIGHVMRSAIFGTFVVTAPLLLVAVIAPEWLAAQVASDAGLAASAGASLRVVALAMLIAIPSQIWLSAVVGTGDTVAALGIELVSTLVMLGITWLTAIRLGWPMALVWLALPITSLVCLLLSRGWVQWGLWKRLEV